MQFAENVVHKELFLSKSDLESVSNEQSGLIDYLVLLSAKSIIGIGVSTFSFYLREARIMSGKDPRSTVLLMLPGIGTDELFYTSAIAATRSRALPANQIHLRNECRRPDGLPCFSTTPMRRRRSNSRL